MITAHQRRLFAVIIVCCSLSSCTVGVPDVIPPTDTVKTSTRNNPVLFDAPDLQGVEKAVDEVERNDGKAGISIMSASGTVNFGTLREGPAWSTIKVPIAAAVLDTEYAKTAKPFINAAIGMSDNASAQTLWIQLGTPEEAAKKVSKVIRTGGDKRTKIPIEQIKQRKLVFGRIPWGLEHQTEFLAGWRCRPEADVVLDAMRNIIPEHTYGIGKIKNSAFKGGWGPDAEGRYLVRQFALIPWGDGELAVAIAAKPVDGTYETGKEMLDEIADSLQTFLRETKPEEHGWRPLPKCPDNIARNQLR